jgi:hypothetical protein
LHVDLDQIVTAVEVQRASSELSSARTRLGQAVLRSHATDPLGPTIP